MKEVDEIGLLLCGKKCVATFEKEGTFYFESTSSYYKALKYKGYWTVSKMRMIETETVTDWVLSIPFDLEKMKSLFKILNK